MDSNVKKITFTTVMVLALSGCASNPDSASSLAADAAASESVSQVSLIKESINKANVTIETAKKNELDWFASELFEEAEQALADAKENYSEFEFSPLDINKSSGFFSSTTYGDAAQESLNVFNAKISEAQMIRSTALTALETAFDYRKQLNTLDAQKYFPNTVKELDKELKKLVDYIADGKPDSAVGAQLDLVVKQRALEVKVVTTIYLSAAQQRLKELQTSAIKDNAPKTLSLAAQVVNAAVAFVNSDPRAIDKIIKKAQGADFSLQHTEQVATAVKSLKQLPEAKYEDYILDSENRLLAISEVLGAGDNRDQTLEKQGEAIVSFVKESMKDDQAMVLTLKQLRSKISDQNSNLEAKSVQIESLKKQLSDKKDAVVLLESKVDQLIAQQAAPALESTPKPTEDIPVTVESEGSVGKASASEATAPETTVVETEEGTVAK